MRSCHLILSKELSEKFGVDGADFLLASESEGSGTDVMGDGVFVEAVDFLLLNVPRLVFDFLVLLPLLVPPLELMEVEVTVEVWSSIGPGV